jgi:predicted small lipoprotein YifL
MLKQISLLTIPTLFIVACGYSGPLYLPQKGTPPQNMSKNQYAPATNAESAAPKSLLPAYITESKESANLKTVSHNAESIPNAD